MTEALTRWLDNHGVSRETDSPAARTARAKERDVPPASRVGPGVPLRVAELTDRCDRCRHMLREHASAALGTICMVGRKGYGLPVGGGRVQWRFCPCDGFFVEQRGSDGVAGS